VRALTHVLLRIAPGQALTTEGAVPAWVREQLGRTPWVVVRRAGAACGLLPVGVRGCSRAERFAAWLPASAVLECITPTQLAARRAWRHHPRRTQVPALAALEQVASIMVRANLAAHWGPGGSVAFELVSGCPTASAASDVDLIVRLDTVLPVATAGALLAWLRQLPVRADVLLETPCGGLALSEYVRASAPYLVRTPGGARLLDDPWAGAAAA
jgi:phosphoribosyl-dephospho-CoA transferase